MSHFPQYTINATNGDANQFNMQGFDVNMLKNLIENNSNVLTQNINGQDVSYMQQNKIPNQYIIQLPNNNGVPVQQPYMMQFPYGQIYYVNQPTQFTSNDGTGTVQYNATSVLPIQLSAAGGPVMQVDVNDLAKLTQQQPSNLAPNPRSRKRSYSNQVKLEGDSLGENEEVQRDTRNRPLLYSCSECSRKFSMQSRLTQHKKCHSGIRPYACTSCNFAFTQKSYLVRHAAVHKEERPYVCELCQKTYKHYGSLANHRKTHKNAKVVDRTTNDETVGVKSEQIAPTDFIQFAPAQDLSQEAQPVDETQFSTDLSTDLFSSASFTQQMATANMSQADVNSSFISQLNFQNSFYSLLDPGAQCDPVKIEMLTTSTIDQPTSSAAINSSSISIDSSCQPINLT